MPKPHQRSSSQPDSVSEQQIRTPLETTIVSAGLLGISPDDSDPDIDAFLENYQSYVRELARKAIPFNIGPYDSDDLTQNVLIKLWLSAEKQSLTSPKAYIRRVVHNETVELVRKDKPLKTLLIDEDGEISQGNVIIAPDVEFNNPEDIVMQKEALAERLSGLRDVLMTLPPRQKKASTCRLNVVADVPELGDAFKEIGIDSEMRWPENKAERQKLQASYAPVKQKLARRLDVDLKQYK